MSKLGDLIRYDVSEFIRVSITFPIRQSAFERLEISENYYNCSGEKIWNSVSMYMHQGLDNIPALVLTSLHEILPGTHKELHYN